MSFQPGAKKSEDFSEDFSDEGLSPEEYEKKQTKREKNRKRRARKKQSKVNKRNNECSICSVEFCRDPDCPSCRKTYCTWTKCGCPPVCRGCFIKRFPVNAKKYCEDPTCRDHHVSCLHGCGSTILVNGGFVNNVFGSLIQLFECEQNVVW